MENMREDDENGTAETTVAEANSAVKASLTVGRYTHRLPIWLPIASWPSSIIF